MMYIIYLSGENVSLAREELKSVMVTQKSKVEIIHDYPRLLVINTDKKISFSDCAFVTEVSRYLSNLDDIKSFDFTSYINTTINVRVIKTNLNVDINGTLLERQIGHLFHTNGAIIDLNDPEHLIRIYKTDEKGFMGELIFLQSQEFSKRKASLRPFHRPVSLDPKIARVMVNLAQVKAGDHVLDPFVGTGGILIEAGLMRCRIAGIDMDEVMVEGTKTNLKSYKIPNSKIIKGDAFDTRNIFGENFDAIVTDFPYGKNTKDDNVRNIAEQFLEYAPSLIKTGGFVSVASNFSDLKIPATLKLKNRFEIYIHKSMSKWIYVFEVI
ncbi:MAG: methyltransferase domain-containing protein [DPANN group archaeon]|nr:methyltransferase domain-containing protein [DPANN group archaeon]